MGKAIRGTPFSPKAPRRQQALQKLISPCPSSPHPSCSSRHSSATHSQPCDPHPVCNRDPPKQADPTEPIQPRHPRAQENQVGPRPPRPPTYRLSKGSGSGR